MPLTIVFVERKNRCNEVAAALQAEGIPAAALHGGLSQVRRELWRRLLAQLALQQCLSAGSCSVLVFWGGCMQSCVNASRSLSLTACLPLSALSCPVAQRVLPPPQYEREAALRDFSSGTVRVLIATDVASRGLDVKGIGHVINMDLPRAFEDYVHRIGEAGSSSRALASVQRDHSCHSQGTELLRGAKLCSRLATCCI